MSQYPLLKEHDPDGTRLRTLPFLLDPGDSLLPATTLVPVDDAGVEIVGGSFAVEVVSIGIISSSASGDLWGVNFKLTGGSDRIGQIPLIRLRSWLASQPSAPAYDQTYRVAIRQL